MFFAFACKTDTKKTEVTDTVKKEEVSEPVKEIVPEATAKLNAETLKTLQFFGAEPFWDVVFTEDYAEYTTPGAAMQKIYYKKEYTDNSKPKLSAVIIQTSDKEIEFQGDLNGGGIKFTIKTEACSDGMSEESFPYSMDFMFDEVGSIQGCGKLK